MIVYTDASVRLRIILGDGPTLADWETWTTIFSSAISAVEARRTLDRLRLTGGLTDRTLAEAVVKLLAIEAATTGFPVTPEVLERASQPLGTVVRTLDAIHVASALLLRESGYDLVFATHDRQQALAARALGFGVIGVEP